jgi:hypothetical protein
VEILIKSMQSAIPLILIYILTSAPATIMKDSSMTKNLTQMLLPDRVMSNAKYFALFGIFAVTFLLNLFVCSTELTAGVVSAFAPVLLAISESTLIYGALFA